MEDKHHPAPAFRIGVFESAMPQPMPDIKFCDLLRRCASIERPQRITSSIDGHHDSQPLDVIQRIIPEQVKVTSTVIGETTLRPETQMAVGIKTNGDTQRVRRHFSVIAVFTADIEAFVRSW